MKKIKNRLIWIILGIIIWESLYRSGLYPVQIFPSIKDILKALMDGLGKGELLIQVAFSFWVIIKGLFIGVLIAFILSFFSYTSSIIQSFVDTAIAVMHPLPGVALLPLVILWFGVGEDAILVIIVHSVLWPLTINIKTGFKDVDKVYIEIARNIGLNKVRVFFHVLMPLSLPFVISGLKIGWSRSWRALISSEMIFGAIGTIGGIGWYLFEKRVFMDTSGMYAGLIVIIIIGILMEDLVFAKVDKYIESNQE